jgi:hypothetical protein
MKGPKIPIIIVSVLFVFIGLIGTAQSKPSQDFEIQVLSTGAEYVSGGDALVLVDVPQTTPLPQVTIELNGEDVTNVFERNPRNKSLTGLVEGMQPGENTLAAFIFKGKKKERLKSLTITNWPITGPIFSGPHEEPFYCQTEDFELGPGMAAGELGPPIDKDCSIETRIDYFYRANDDTFKPLTDPSEYPVDLVETTTIEGNTVPYIVRVETGTTNRAIYQIAMLADPQAPSPNPWKKSPGWNGRLIYKFGGGCNRGWYLQGWRTGDVFEDKMLSKGYATATSTLNAYRNNCNDLLTAEALMMVKERFIEAYGPSRHTIGWGCSGGSYQGYQIGDNYPGLLDGIIVGCTFSEVIGQKANYLTDSHLLKNYFDMANVEGIVTWTEEKQLAVHGGGVFEQIARMSDSSLRYDPVPGNFDDIVPEELRYDPVTNTTGLRGIVWDHMVNTLGRDPVTGFSLRPLDNEGVQYGLEALNAGKIDKTHFLDLNEKIGGHDIDYEFIPERTVHDPYATRRTYQGGRILNGGGGLAAIPIIDYHGYVDDQPGGNAHVKFYRFGTRERLINANGHADNHVMLTVDGYCPEGSEYGCGIWSLENPVLEATIDQMDQWLVNIGKDASDDPLDVKVVRNKPSDLVDACWLQNGAQLGDKIVEEQTFDGGICNELYPTYPPPRLIAGEPIAGDIVKCQLKPIDYSDYNDNVGFNSAEKTRLENEIFPTGVCDWSKPGVEQYPLVPWASFGPSPVNLIFELDAP